MCEEKADVLERLAAIRRGCVPANLKADPERLLDLLDETRADDKHKDAA